MSRLSVHHQSSPQIPNKVLGHAEDIASTLAAVGIEYRELPLEARVQAGDASEAILAALGEALERLKRDSDLSQAEVISIDQRHWPREGDKPVQVPVEVLADGAQLYLFLAGQGLLSLHVDDYVYALVGERNALISVPVRPEHTDRGHPGSGSPCNSAACRRRARAGGQGFGQAGSAGRGARAKSRTSRV